MATKKPSGDPKDVPDYQVFSLRLPGDLHRQLKFLAVSEGTSLNELVVQVLRKWWSEHPDKSKFSKL